jgi:hypothetical protein
MSGRSASHDATEAGAAAAACRWLLSTRRKLAEIGCTDSWRLAAIDKDLAGHEATQSWFPPI